MLQRMELQEIEPGTFCGLDEMESLNLRFNKLTEVPELTPLKRTLVKLLLSDNQLLRFPKKYFEGFIKLSYLDVGKNHLQTVPAVGWISLTLLILRFRENNITSIEGMATPERTMRLAKLHEINLNDNQINAFDVTILSRMPKLVYLYLHGNSLTYIDDYRPFFKYDALLTGNPFHCDIGMAWMTSVKNNFLHSPMCATPWCVKGRALFKMSKCTVL